ncbi:MAG TPA: DUF2752 domain-containing protein [Verrucomicrobiae bacterium]|nr:DUF2752 domain-containing protein [Verrucomicrobiae bacterium]
MQLPPVIQRPRPHLAWWLGGVLALLLITAGVVLFRFNPSQYNFYPRCTLYVVTGLYCPGCGSQRALYHLLHGHLATALRCNALLILALPVLASIFVRYAGRWAANKQMPPFVIQTWWVKLLIGALFLFAILRNIHCSPFIYLTPP